MNKPGSIIAAVAGIAVLSGFGLTHHHTATATHTATAAASTVHQVSHSPKTIAAHQAAAHLAAAHPVAAHAAAHPVAADPSLVWLASAGGQAQVLVQGAQPPQRQVCGLRGDQRALERGAGGGQITQPVAPADQLQRVTADIWGTVPGGEDFLGEKPA